MEEVDKMNIDTGFLTVNLLEVNYIDMMKEMYDLSNLTLNEERNTLFPYEWDLIRDNNVKIRALRDALRKKIKLIETEELKNYFTNMSSKSK